MVPQEQEDVHVTVRKPFDDAQAEQAIEEGRRVSRNLPFQVTATDIETLFNDIASEINLSVSPCIP